MFYSIPNLTAQSVTPIEKPWEVQCQYPDFGGDKTAYSQWAVSLATQHHFISGFEALAPAIRIHSEDNPPVRMYALIVDYDSKFDEDRRLKLLDHPPSEFLPTFCVRTFSGHARLVWVYEGPTLIGSADHGQKFLAVLSKKLNLKGWLAGLDTGALAVKQYFEIGTWFPVAPDARIPKAILDLWSIEAGSRAKMSRTELPTIPLEVVHEEVEKRFPRRWTGPFEMKRMGVRFWDPTADNPRGACVLPTGMMAFSGEQAFVSWHQIFGQKFVEAFLASRVEGLVDRWVYDGAKFWQGLPSGRWVGEEKDKTVMMLKDAGMSSRPGSYNSCTSEIEHFLVHLMQHRRVERALPFTHRPRGLILHPHDGKPYLNTSMTKCVQPAAPFVSGKMHFVDLKSKSKTVAMVLQTFFTPENNRPETIERATTQLVRFLAWCKYFYTGCLEQNPRPGQVLILVGPTGVGKTFFMRNVIGALVGGYADASTHLVGGDKWTSHLCDKALWMVDDSSPAADNKSYVMYSSKIKSYVANATTHYDQKYEKTGDVPFDGRITICANTDAESLRILPSIDQSSGDKIIMLRVSDKVAEFSTRDDLEKIIPEELPYFARFLLDWDYPEGTFCPTARFGVTGYHHPDLIIESRRQGQAGVLFDILSEFMQEQHKRFADDTLVMTAARLYSELSAYNAVCMREFTTRGMAVALGILAKQGHRIYSVVDTHTRTMTWKIMYPLNPPDEGAKEEPKDVVDAAAESVDGAVK